MYNLLPFIYRVSIENSVNNKLNGMTLREQLIDWSRAALEDKATSEGKLTEYREIGHNDVVVSVRWDDQNFIVVIHKQAHAPLIDKISNW